jgi:AcrR family transcriptional regulator
MSVAETSRRYESSLRAEQLERTRQRILDAVAEHIRQGGADEISMARIAKRAGVSVPTVYSHFPTKEALLDAFGGWLREHFSWATQPMSADDIPRLLPATFARLDEDAALVRGSRIVRAGQQVRAQTRRARMKITEDALADVVAGLPARDRRRALAVIQLLLSSAAWDSMTENWGLEGREAGKAAAWAIRVLIDEIRTNPNSIREVPT